MANVLKTAILVPDEPHDLDNGSRMVPVMDVFIRDQPIPDIMPVITMGPEDHMLLSIRGTGPLLEHLPMHSGSQLIQLLRSAVPSETFTSIFMTALVFEEQCIYRSDMRRQPQCRGMWRFGEAPIMIRGVNRRLIPQDVPGWCDGPVETRSARDELFYQQMDFLWRIHLDPALPFLLLPRTRENGQDGGVQAICRFDCT